MSSAEGALSFGTASLLRRTIGGTDENLPEGHQLDSLVRATYENPTVTCPAMVAVLLQRLQKFHGQADPNVKLKCLRVIRHCLQRGRQEFIQTVRRQATALKELLTYNCPPDPLRGNAPAKAVRQEAHLCMDALYAGGHNSTSNTAQESSFYKYRPPETKNDTLRHQPTVSTTSMARPSLGRRMEGFGNTEFRDQNNITSRGVVEAVAEAIPDSLVTGVTQAVNRVAQYLPAPVATHIETLGSRLPKLRHENSSNQRPSFGYAPSTMDQSGPTCCYRPPQEDVYRPTITSSTKGYESTRDPTSPELLAVVSLIENTCAPTTSCRPQLPKQTITSFTRRVNATEIGRSAAVLFLLSKLGYKPDSSMIPPSRLATTWQAKVRVLNCLQALCGTDENCTIARQAIDLIREIANSGTRASSAATDLLTCLGDDQTIPVKQVSPPPPVVDLLDDFDEEGPPSQDDLLINNQPSLDEERVGHHLSDESPKLTLLDDPEPSPFGFIV